MSPQIHLPIFRLQGRARPLHRPRRYPARYALFEGSFPDLLQECDGHHRRRFPYQDEPVRGPFFLLFLLQRLKEGSGGID